MHKILILRSQPSLQILHVHLDLVLNRLQSFLFITEDSDSEVLDRVFNLDAVNLFYSLHLLSVCHDLKFRNFKL